MIRAPYMVYVVMQELPYYLCILELRAVHPMHYRIIAYMFTPFWRFLTLLD